MAELLPIPLGQFTGPTHMQFLVEDANPKAPVPPKKKIVEIYTGQIDIMYDKIAWAGGPYTDILTSYVPLTRGTLQSYPPFGLPDPDFAIMVSLTGFFNQQDTPPSTVAFQAAVWNAKVSFAQQDFRNGGTQNVLILQANVTAFRGNTQYLVYHITVLHKGVPTFGNPILPMAPDELAPRIR
jgi:hypothetical protein